jgi:hypothetical protein
MTAANADWVPQWTPLAAAMSTRSSISYTVEDNDTAPEDVPTAPPPTPTTYHQVPDLGGQVLHAL